MIPSNNIKTTGDPWASYKRYKVNEVVTHNGASYQNTTGINTEPVTGSVNWYSSSFLLFSDLPFIDLSSNSTPKLFRLIKNPDNNNPNNKNILQQNDYVADGFYNSDVLINTAKYIGTGAITDFGTDTGNYQDGSYTNVNFTKLS
ncbi:hypothetical protein [Tenacibaculum finnmarkense]|uniref:hypothetical protein n=1 Tax=Tenacibaculum finnmarkense TaxID=2781243 RepID=UPI002079BD8A|nr:hypothetical protein [Tenacibaculum finnmarkense]MCM8906821.1 hypothetical protein [Tenacibaculum finnmarkense genomovar finnmarkense]